MSTTTSHLAATAAVLLALCASTRSAAAQGGPIAPLPAVDSAAAAVAVAAPAPLDSGLVTSAAAEDSTAVRPSRPIGSPVPLGEPVPRPMPESFLPASRTAERSANVPVAGSGMGMTGVAFMDDQLTHRRVVDAQLDAKFDLKALFAERGLTYPPRDLFLRLFKQEQVLEVWVRDTPDAETYTLLREYPICAISGRLGPKTRIDDFQTPEGFYYVEGFNPESDFHLSLRLNYPNPADRIIGVADAWGGDIYIHGGCSTIGCFPITDEAMAELYWLAVEARAAGQEVIPVHVFPARLDEPTMQWLRGMFERDERLLAFWENLREGYDWFETTGRLPLITVDPAGHYVFAEPPAPGVPGSPVAGAPAEESGLLGEAVAPAGPPAAGAPAAELPAMSSVAEPAAPHP